MALTFELPARFVIRACEERDLDNLEWFGIFKAHRAIFHEAFRRHRAGENPMLVLDLGGFPVGQVWIDLMKKRAQSTGVLWALRVFPIFQGMGLGYVLAGEEREAYAYEQPDGVRVEAVSDVLLLHKTVV
jgi:hypothetical protein